VVDTRPPHFTAKLTLRKLVPLGYTLDDKTLVSWSSLTQLFHIRVIATLGDERQVVPVFRHSKAGSVYWPRVTKGSDGRFHRVKAAAGAWKLQLVARDQAGNRTAVSLGTVQVTAPQR
jgi:hypothetical protein